MVGLSYSNETDWIYENPGDGSLLLVNATTLTDLPEEKSKTGVAFYQDSYDKCFDLPDTKEIWIKFDVFFGDDAWEVGDENWWIYGYYRRIDFEFWGDDDDLSVDLKNDVELNRSYTATLHVIFGTSESVIEIWIDDKSVYSYTGADSSSWTEFGKDYGNIHMTSEGTRSFFSNITISNVEFENNNTITEFTGDLFRKVNKSESTQADTLRQTATNLTSFDILIKPSTKIFATYMPVPEKISADLFRKVTKNESIQVDTLRQIIQREVTPTVSKADTFRKITRYESFSAYTIRITKIPESTQADTYRQVSATEIAIADLNRALREVANYDTFRKVTQKEKAIASTVIRVPHIWNYFIKPTLRTAKLLADNQPSLVNTFKNYGITAVNITLSERTLSDNFTFQTAKPININDAVQGSLLDYHFNFLVEKITQTELIREVKGMYNVDELLYTQFFLPTTIIDDKEQVVLTSAWEHVGKVASHLHLSANRKFSNFTPQNLSGNVRITYADLLTSLFNWTARVPQRLVNVFIRGGTLHCIQRGKEDSVFDISDLPHSRLTINKKLVRSLWSNPKGQSNETDADADADADADTDSDFENKFGTDPNDDANSDPTVDYLYDEYAEPFSGTISFSDDGCATTLRYSDGRLVYESNETWNAKSTLDSSVTYSYIEIFPPNMSLLSIANQKAFNKNFYGDFYLAKKKFRSSSTQINGYVKIEYADGSSPTTFADKEITKQWGVTDYNYATTENDIYLSDETEDITTKTYETDESGNLKLSDAKTDIRETFHVPIGNGWYGQSVYLNGVAQGSNISQGKPGNKVNQYTIGEVQKTLKGWKITYTKDDGNDSGISDDSGESGSESGNTETYDDWRRKLAPIADISFPVKELNTLQELTNDLLWLNRKIQETVTVDLISPINNGIPSINHIIDFTERVKLDGNEYFLVSNNISFTPRKLIQKLQLIRWY